MVVFACVLLLAWLLATYVRAQQALRWWQRRQSLQLCREAEGIRNGLLQESLSLRRQLELSLVQPLGEPEQTHQTLLTKIETFHTALNELSDHLAPPYLDDSLPLAIRFAMETWQAQHPQSQLKLELPVEWTHESPEQSRVLLMTIDELLRLALPDRSAAVSLAVCLTSQPRLNELKLHLSCLQAAQPMTLAQATEFDQLSRAFCFLMPGKYSCQHKDQTLSCSLRWQRVPYSTLTS